MTKTFCDICGKESSRITGFNAKFCSFDNYYTNARVRLSTTLIGEIDNEKEGDICARCLAKLLQQAVEELNSRPVESCSS